MRCSRVLVPAAVFVFACLQASGQSVISARSGVLNFSEGSVFIDNQPVHAQAGTFPNIHAGSTLRTDQGRAEVLLTPGVFLRLDRNSAIRMVSTELTDTRVEFKQGSAIVDSTEAQSGNSPAVLYWGAEVRFSKPGVYRLDAEPAPVLQVYTGEANVKHDGTSSAVDPSKEFFFLAGTETNKYGDGNFDAFYDWAKNRGDLIAADNRSAAESADPGDIQSGPSLGPGPVYDPGIPPSPGYYPSGPGYYPSYGGSVAGAYPGGMFYPYGAYAPFGFDPFWPGVIFVVPRYRYPHVHSRWPNKPEPSRMTPVSAGLVPSSNGLLPGRNGLLPGHSGVTGAVTMPPRYVPRYGTTYGPAYRGPAYHPLYRPSGIGVRTYTPRYTPATPRVSRPAGMAMPGRGAGMIGAHPMHR